MSKCSRLSRCYVDLLGIAPRFILLALVIVLAFCLLPASRFLHCTVNVYSEVKGSPTALARAKLREHFGHDPPECDVVLIQQTDVTARGLDLEQSGLLAEITSRTESFVKQRGLSIELDSYVGLVREGLPNVAAPLMSPDKRSALIVLRRVGPPINKTVGSIENALTEHLRQNYQEGIGRGVGQVAVSYIGIAGIAPFVVDGTKAAARDLQRSNPICVPLCFAVLAFLVRSWRLMLITFCCMCSANMACFAVLDIIAETKGTVMSTSVPVIAESTMLALTFDYSLFLLVRFQEEICFGVSFKKAVSASVRYSGHVILTSGLTLCYCALMVTQLPLEESKSLSVGMLMAIVSSMVVNLLVTPVMLLAFPAFFAVGAGQVHPLPLRGAAPMSRLKSGSSSIDSLGSLGSDDSSCSTDEDLEPDGDEQVKLTERSPHRSERQRVRADRRRRREEAALESTSAFWRSWSNAVISPACVVLVLILLLAATVMALAGPTAIHLEASQVTMDFTMLGAEGSETLTTLKKLGQSFSEGYVGPVTLLMVAKQGQTQAVAPTAQTMTETVPLVYSKLFWDSATALLQRLNAELLEHGHQGSIVSAMYLSSAAGETVVPLSMASGAERIPGSFTKIRELRYLINQTINAQKTAANAIISPDSRTTSQKSKEWTQRLRTLVDAFNSDSSSVEVFISSETAAMMDVEEGVFQRLPRLILLSLLGCLLMIGVIFRSVMIAVRGIVTITFTLAVVYMAAHSIFASGSLRSIGIPVGGTEGLFFMVPVSTFTIVLGLALDYDIFLLGRIYELRERGHSTSEAVAGGVAQTGHVITCAGIMMAIAFGGMMLSEVPSMRQASWIFVMAVLLDTFVVRTAVTPALTAALGEATWWPREFDTAE